MSIFSIIALLFIFVKYRRLSKLHIFLVGLITGWVVFYYLGFSLLSVYSLVYDVNNNSVVGMGFVSRFISASTITYILYLLLLVFYQLHIVKSLFITAKQRILYVFGVLALPFITSLCIIFVLSKTQKKLCELRVLW